MPPRRGAKAAPAPAAPFDLAHKALLEHHEKTKSKGYKERRQHLVAGKKILDGILAADSVTNAQAQRWKEWLEELEDDTEAPWVANPALPPALIIEYHYAAIELIYDRLLKPLAEKLIDTTMLSPAHLPSVDSDGVAGEAERVATILCTLVESATTIEDGDGEVPKEFHSNEWLYLLIRILETLGGGQIGGCQTCTAVSSLLKTIFCDSSPLTGRNLILRKKKIGQTLGELLATSSSAILTINLLDVVSTLSKKEKNSKDFIRQIFGNRWSDEVTDTCHKLFQEISNKTHHRSSKIMFMDLVNAISKDDAGFRPRGFQTTALLKEEQDLMSDVKAKALLKQGAVITFIDLWQVTVNAVNKEGVLDPFNFEVERINGFDQAHAGAFLLEIKDKDKESTFSLALSINPSQAPALEDCLRTLLSTGPKPGEPVDDEYDMDFDVDLSHEALAALEEQAKALRSDDTIDQYPTSERTAATDLPLEDEPIGSEVVGADEEVATEEAGNVEVAHKEVANEEAAHRDMGLEKMEDTVDESKDTDLVPPVDTDDKPTEDSPPIPPNETRKTRSGFRPPAPVAQKSVPKKKKSGPTIPDVEPRRTPDVEPSATPNVEVSPPRKAKAKESPDATPVVPPSPAPASEAAIESTEKKKSPAPASPREPIPDELPTVVATNPPPRRSKSAAMRGKDDKPVQKEKLPAKKAPVKAVDDRTPAQTTAAKASVPNKKKPPATPIPPASSEGPDSTPITKEVVDVENLAEVRASMPPKRKASVDDATPRDAEARPTKPKTVKSETTKKRYKPPAVVPNDVFSSDAGSMGTRTPTTAPDMVDLTQDSDQLMPPSSPPKAPTKKPRRAKVPPPPAPISTPAPPAASPVSSMKIPKAEKGEVKSRERVVSNKAPVGPSFSPDVTYFGQDEETLVEHNWGATSTPLLKRRASELTREPAQPVNSERPQKKARFSIEPARPQPYAPPRAQNVATEINYLLRGAMDVVADLTTARFQEPNKQLVATRRRLVKRMALTATKWWGESEAVLETVQEAHKPISDMYASLAKYSNRLVEQTKAPDQKARYILQEKSTPLPETLF